jgi:hypothetical protein
MNSDKIILPPPPPYTFSTIQPTNSYTSLFSSTESSQAVLETTSMLTEDKKDTTGCAKCLDCLQCCATFMEFFSCCCLFIECLAVCNR